MCAVAELQHEEKEPDVFICDEYDYMLEKCPVAFGCDHQRKTKMFGLAPVYHSSKVYFLSATCDTYVQKLLKHIFDFKTDALIDMPMVLEISTGTNMEPFMSDSVIRETTDELYKDLWSLVEDKIFEQPFFIFEDAPNIGFRRKANETCREAQLPCIAVGKEGQAMETRARYANCDSGLFFVPFD